MTLRIATFNLENLGTREGEETPEARARLPLHLNALRAQLGRLDADTIAFQECLDPKLLDPLLQDLNYPYRVVAAGGSSPLRVGVASRYPLGVASEVAASTTCTAVDPKTGLNIDVSGAFSRPVLRVPCHFPGLDVTLFVLHGKSKIPSFTPERPDPGAGPWASFADVARGRLITEVKRLAQAVELRREVDDILVRDPDASVVVLGDFNDTLESEAVRCLLGDADSVHSPHLEAAELYPCELKVPVPRRFTQIYRGQREMIDHILVSRRLRELLVEVVILNEGLRDSGATPPGTGQFVGSDHAPLLAVFRT